MLGRCRPLTHPGRARSILLARVIALKMILSPIRPLIVTARGSLMPVTKDATSR